MQINTLCVYLRSKTSHVKDLLVKNFFWLCCLLSTFQKESDYETYFWNIGVADRRSKKKESELSAICPCLYFCFSGRIIFHIHNLKSNGKDNKVCLWLILLMHLIPFYLKRDATTWSSMDMCILKTEKKWSVKKIRLTALGTEGLYSFSQLNMSCNCAVFPRFSPLRCSSSLLENSLQVRICARLVLGFSEEQPKRGLVSCGWEDVEICLERKDLRTFDQAEHRFGITACPKLLWTSRGWGLALQYVPS